MDIGTAKLPLAERRGITHHLLDVLDVTEPATVAEFQGWAREVIDDCRGRGVSPCWWEVRRSTPARSSTSSSSRAPTPTSANGSRRSSPRSGPSPCTPGSPSSTPPPRAQVLPSNGRRVVRALEVIEITGRPFTASLPGAALPLRQRGAGRRGHRPRDPRPPHRAARPADVGPGLRGRGARSWSVSASARGVRRAGRSGYQQILAFLDGELTEDEAREKTFTGTRRFARRQDSWFRKDPRITWVRYDDPARVEKALDAVRRCC